jgi:hypothetical protein
MRFKTNMHDGWLIGDPHFGRDFRNGTPLHRRGERERMQLEQFRTELTLGETMCVMVGDLFDKPFVPLSAINAAAWAVKEAAEARPHITFVFMAGNHDKSREIGVRGAWEIFELAVGLIPNVVVLNEPAQMNDVAFFPWQWDVSAAEQVERFVPTGDVHTAIGHWDLRDYGGDTSHLAPVNELLKLNPNINLKSGHYHEEGLFIVEQISVECTGSMQPYTHGEDPNGTMYLTLSLDETLARGDLHDKCVRVILQPGETLPDIDCLQLTKLVADREVEEIEIGEIGVGGFNMKAVLAEEFEQNEVPAPVQTFIGERIGDFA